MILGFFLFIGATFATLLIGSLVYEAWQEYRDQ